MLRPTDLAQASARGGSRRLALGPLAAAVMRRPLVDLVLTRRRAAGRILLKGENIALIMEAGGADGGEGGEEQ